MPPSELTLYKPVAAWLKRRKGCFATGTNTGLHWARIDVLGLRDVGGHLSGSTEVVAVEVKRDGVPFGNALGQAHSYSVYADRCYLAYHRTKSVPPSDDAADMASALGVGLIEMTGSDSAVARPRISELLPAPSGTPIERLRLEVVERLGYSTCTICHSMFERGEGKRFRANVTTTAAKAITDNKGLIYWLDEVAERQVSPARTSRTSWTSTEMVYNRRYICPDCLRALFGDRD